LDEGEIKMKDLTEVVIIKLGGSLITDKSRPFSLRKDVIESAIKQIKKSNEKLIIVHGGGSFGHPIAKTYKLSEGLDPSVENQILGLAETHDAMNNLNSHIVNCFIEERYPIISIQPSSIFNLDYDQIVINSIEIIESYLNLGLTPILYGDIILDSQISFGILSGDRIILELCKKLKTYKVTKVIFVIEKDGIFIKDEEGNACLAPELHPNELNNLDLAELGKKIDVTGGIIGKIKSIEKICKHNIPVQIINGLEEGMILKALQDQELTCTNICGVKIEKKSEISERKIEHLKIPMKFNVQHSKNYFKYVELVHHPLPELDLEEIDLSVRFFNKSISAPICIAAITGGHPVSKEINKILASAAEEENIIMSVGSQRAALVDSSIQDSFSIVRDVAPSIPIIGNLGIGQISTPDFKPEDFINCIEMIKADMMAIHFNALHELVQNEGDISYKSFEDKFKEIRENTQIPIIAKEVGTGFNKDLAQKLESLGIDGFDVGGTGGTSFAAIESYRKEMDAENYTRSLSEVFREWGLSTPVSILNVRDVSQKPIIATGGLRTGEHIAKNIVLGADIGGFAFNFLLSAWKDYENNTISNTVNEIKTLKKELRSCLWLMNVKNIEELKGKEDKRKILGKLYQWLNQ